MAMASLAPFIPRRPPPSLQFLSRRPPARQYCFLGLLQLHRHSSSSCQYPPQVAPSTAGARQGGDAEQGEKAANAQEKGAAASAAVRRRPAAPKGRPGAPRGGGGGGTTTKPKRKGPTPPGDPKEGAGGSGGVIHARPDVAPSSSSS